MIISLQILCSLLFIPSLSIQKRGIYEEKKKEKKEKKKKEFKRFKIKLSKIKP